MRDLMIKIVAGALLGQHPLPPRRFDNTKARLRTPNRLARSERSKV